MAVDLQIPSRSRSLPRLDQALVGDLRSAFTSRPILAFLALQALAAVVFVARRGSGVAQTVLLVWAGLAFVGFICWSAGRHRLAHPESDPVTRARARTRTGPHCRSASPTA